MAAVAPIKEALPEEGVGGMRKIELVLRLVMDVGGYTSQCKYACFVRRFPTKAALCNWLAFICMCQSSAPLLRKTPQI